MSLYPQSLTWRKRLLSLSTVLPLTLVLPFREIFKYLGMQSRCYVLGIWPFSDPSLAQCNSEDPRPRSAPDSIEEEEMRTNYVFTSRCIYSITNVETRPGTRYLFRTNKPSLHSNLHRLQMDDSFELNFALNSGSHLLSEAPILPSSSQEDHDSTQADLSLSELSLQDRTVTSDKPFTLLNPDRTRESAIDENEEEDENADVEEEHEDETAMRDRGRRRNEKLQSDLFVLRKLNSSFALYNEALENTGSANEVSIVSIHSEP